MVVGHTGDGLGSSETGITRPGGGRDELWVSVAGVKHGDGDVESVAPTKGVKGDGAGGAEDDEASEWAAGSGPDALAAVSADAVVKVEVASLDGEVDAVSVGDGDGLVGTGVAVGVVECFLSDSGGRG
jgi:hypothetical protein